MTTTKKPRTWFVEKLIKLGACSEAIRYAKTHRTFPAAWNACEHAAWQWWLVSQLRFNVVHETQCPACDPRRLASFLRRFPADRVAKALRKSG